MKKKLKKWEKKLTARERKHLKEDAGVITLAGMQRNINRHARMKLVNPDIEPCWTCKMIAQKLGMKPEPMDIPV